VRSYRVLTRGGDALLAATVYFTHEPGRYLARCPDLTVYEIAAAETLERAEKEATDWLLSLARRKRP
jgi:hypothetical protein